jgi:hypothetical protein
MELQKENGVSGGVKGVARVGEWVGRQSARETLPPRCLQTNMLSPINKTFFSAGRRGSVAFPQGGGRDAATAAQVNNSNTRKKKVPIA